MTKKEIATTATTEIAMPCDYGTDAGVGMDLSLTDLLVPFVTILQKLSPELESGDEKFIEGAEVGEILNKGTKERFNADTGILIVPALRRYEFIEYQPNRGGFVAAHKPTDAIVRTAKSRGVKDEKGNFVLENGNILTETNSIFAIQVNEDREPVGYVVVPFSGAKLSAWRNYFNKVDSVKFPVGNKPPIFAHLIRLTSISAVSKVGNKPYRNFKMDPANGGVMDSLLTNDTAGYVAGRKLLEAVSEGRATADTSTEVVEDEDNPF